MVCSIHGGASGKEVVPAADPGAKTGSEPVQKGLVSRPFATATECCILTLNERRRKVDGGDESGFRWLTAVQFSGTPDRAPQPPTPKST